jgi:myo-inositol-1(or 4)-monophosphatase
VNVRLKGEQSSVVTDADLASERWIIQRIQERFPQHSILAEETGYARHDSEFTWVIDPLDGTSNFAAGLPWFGVQIAVLHNQAPILAAMYLPTTGALYVAEKGLGTFRDDQRVQVTREAQLRRVLCAFGLDAATSPAQSRQQAEWLTRVSSAVRNIRATNSLFDFCYTLDGRLGAAVNLNTKIWDIAPFALLLPEAGGQLSDLAGADVVFDLANEPFDRSYAVLGASRLLHPQLVASLG